MFGKTAMSYGLMLRKSPKRKFSFLMPQLAFCLLLVLSSFSTQDVSGSNKAEGKDWRSKQRIWWKEEKIVKEVIISHLALLEKFPALQREEELYSDIFNLLLLFDSMSSKESLETLASLSSYYIGEYQGEVYLCLLL